jgi:hypothetical protein
MPETLAQQRRRWEVLCREYPNSAETIFACSDGWTIQRLCRGDDVRRVGHFLCNCWQGSSIGAIQEDYNQFCTLNDEAGIPRAAFFWTPEKDYISAPLRHHNYPTTPEDWKRLIEWQPNSRSLRAIRAQYEPIVHPRQISLDELHIAWSIE